MRGRYGIKGKKELLTLAKESRALDPYSWWYKVWALLVTPLPLGKRRSPANSEYVLANQKGSQSGNWMRTGGKVTKIGTHMHPIHSVHLEKRKNGPHCLYNQGSPSCRWVIRIESVQISWPVVYEALEDVNSEQQLSTASGQEVLCSVEYALEGVLIKDWRLAIRTECVVARSVEVAKVRNILPQPRVERIK